MVSEPAEALDGRQSRTARSRQAICEACLDLVQEGELQPSAALVAARAGVSRRSIFNHFADLAELYDAVVEAGIRRCAPLLEEIPADEAVARRVERLAEVRARFLDAAAPFARALTALALVGPGADQAERVWKDGLRRQQGEVERLFGRELADLEAEGRAELLEALSVATSAVLWDHLRRSRGISSARARAVMQRIVLSLLRDVGVEAT